MANHKSAKKRARQGEKKRIQNKTKVSRLRTFIKKLKEAIQNKEKKQAEELLVTVQSLFAKLSKVSTFKKNTVARKTSRLTKQVNSL